MDRTVHIIYSGSLLNHPSPISIIYIYIYMYDSLQKNPATKVSMELSLLFVGTDSVTEAISLDLLVSGRFRKVSGSLSGSLRLLYSFIAVPEGSGRYPEACPEACFLFACMSAVPEGSGRFPEACPEACLKTLISCIPEGSGRFPEALPEGVQNNKSRFWCL